MAILSKGTDFSTGDQVTALKLDNLVDAATFASGAVDSSTTQLSGSGQIIVKDSGISTAKIADDAVTTAKILNSNVTKAKIENVADMKVLGNTSGSATAPQEVSVLDEDDMSSDSNTAIATQQSIKAYVDSSATSASTQFGIIKSDPLGVRSSTNSYFISMSEVFDPDSIISFSSGDISFASTGTYLIDITGSFVDSDGSSGDFYEVHLTSSTSSTTNLLDGAGPDSAGDDYDSKPFSIKYIRTVSDVSTDKLAIYVNKVSSADPILWNAFDVYIVVTKLT